MTIRIVTGFSGDYTVANLSDGTTPESVQSAGELRIVLRLMGMPTPVIDETIRRLGRERLIEVVF